MTRYIVEQIGPKAAAPSSTGSMRTFKAAMDKLVDVYTNEIGDALTNLARAMRTHSEALLRNPNHPSVADGFLLRISSPVLVNALGPGALTEYSFAADQDYAGWVESLIHSTIRLGQQSLEDERDRLIQAADLARRLNTVGTASAIDAMHQQIRDLEVRMHDRLRHEEPMRPLPPRSGPSENPWSKHGGSKRRGKW